MTVITKNLESITNLSQREKLFSKFCMQQLHPNVIVAGGAIRRLFCEPHEEDEKSDIDLFFTNNETAKQVIAFYSNIKNNTSEIIEKPGLLETTIGNCRTQLITRRMFKNVEDLFNDFDFTVCQFAYQNKILYTTKNAENHLKEKKLITTNKSKFPHEYRWYKYILMGFMPERQVIKLESGEEVFVYLEEGVAKVYKNDRNYTISKSGTNIVLTNEDDEDIDLSIEDSYSSAFKKNNKNSRVVLVNNYKI